MRLAFLIAATVLLGTACPPPGTTGSCSAGKKGCTCNSGACDDGLHCDRGYCVDGAACTRGELACGCKTDHTCNAGLSCSADVCVTSTGPGPGERGGACLTGNTCNTGLECVADQCQDPACPTGTTGCPCGTGNSCVDSANSCQQNLCAPSSCVAGMVGCVCAAGACSDGTACREGFCQAPNRLAGTVSSTDARACEAIFTQGAREVATVRFPATVLGETVRQGKKLGVAFTAKRDAPVDGTAFELEFSGNQSVATDAITQSEVHCYGRNGGALQSATISLH